MEYTVRWATIDDFDALVSFINEVFGIDFKDVLPKFYLSNNNIALRHVIAEDSSGIIACAGVFTNEVKFLNKNLTLAIVGSVSVHTRARRLGLMKQLMLEIMRKIDELHPDFAVLSGHRQRYEYFGFTTAGIMYEFDFEKQNLLHSKEEKQIKFRLTEYGKDEAIALSKIHESKSVRYVRPVFDFFKIAKSYGNKVYMVYEKEEFIGYILAGQGYINEIMLTTNNYPEVCMEFMRAFSVEKVKCLLNPTQTEAIRECCLLSERYNIKNCCNLRIYNYDKFIEAYLQLKNSFVPLDKGKEIIQIIGKGNYIITVANEITVQKTTRKADHSFSEFEAVQKLFTAYGYTMDKSINNNWFPLPFYIENVDNA